MKVTVSIPDELWREASPADSTGPSDTVQRALKVLVEQQRIAAQPLANAPDRTNLERYTAMFDKAVESASESIGLALDNGYRFGLMIAPGLVVSDFELLDERTAGTELRRIISNWGEDPLPFSDDFGFRLREVFNAFESEGESEERSLLEEVIGEGEFEPAVGVRWVSSDGGGIAPYVSATYADGIVAALRDVRDEAIRRRTANPRGTQEH